MTNNTTINTDPVAPLLMAISEAGRSLGVGRTTVYQLIATGRLQVVRIGRRSLIPAQDLVSFVDSLKAVDL